MMQWCLATCGKVNHICVIFLQKSTAQSNIIFSNIQVQDGGKYTCEARNSAVDSNGNNIVATIVKNINIKCMSCINTHHLKECAE